MRQEWYSILSPYSIIVKRCRDDLADRRSSALPKRVWKGKSCEQKKKVKTCVFARRVEEEYRWDGHRILSYRAAAEAISGVFAMVDGTAEAVFLVDCWDAVTTFPEPSSFGAPIIALDCSDFTTTAPFSSVTAKGIYVRQRTAGEIVDMTNTQKKWRTICNNIPREDIFLSAVETEDAGGHAVSAASLCASVIAASLVR